MWSLFPRPQYISLNQVTVSRSALLHNHDTLQGLHPTAKVCPVLKSNAYGHGLTVTAPIFDEMECPLLIVDSLFEAYELFKLNLKTPILIMGYTDPANFTIKPLPFEVVIFDLQLAEILNKHQPGCRVHIFVDTGMTREGVTLPELPTFLEKLKTLTNLQVVGLCSHFADADNPRSQEHPELQVAAFKKALKLLKKHGFDPQWRHISASAGALKFHDPVFNLIRGGLAHYGINPLEPKDAYYQNVSLLPALEFSSTLAQIKTVPKNTKVGYNGIFTTSKKTTLGLIPAGYYDGVDRRLSNVGFVKIRDTFCPIVGRVSMNMTMVDLSDVPAPKQGEKVVIYSAVDEDANSITEAARVSKTIPYELLVHLAETVRRTVV